MKLSDFDEAKLKRIALELQSALLESPCGEKLDIELEYVLAIDAFKGTNIKLSAEWKDRKVFVLHVRDEFDSEREEPFGPEGLRVIVASTAFCYFPMINGDSHRLRSLSPAKMDELVNGILNLLFFIIPTGPEHFEPVKGIKTTIAVKHGRTFVDASDPHSPIFLRYSSGIKLDELAVGQTLMVEIATASDAFVEFIKLKQLTVDGENSHDLKSCYEKHGVKSLLALVKAVPIKITITDLTGEHEFSSMLKIKPHGVAAALFYNDTRCHVDLLVKA